MRTTRNYTIISDLIMLTSAKGMGGAIMAADQVNVSMCGTLDGNQADGNGGGIATVGKASLMLCGTASARRNRAVQNGGGLYAAGDITDIGNAH